jgi:hypothetical protein
MVIRDGTRKLKAVSAVVVAIATKTKNTHKLREHCKPLNPFLSLSTAKP